MYRNDFPENWILNASPSVIHNRPCNVFIATNLAEHRKYFRNFLASVKMHNACLWNLIWKISISIHYFSFVQSFPSCRVLCRINFKSECICCGSMFYKRYIGPAILCIQIECSSTSCNGWIYITRVSLIEILRILNLLMQTYITYFTSHKNIRTPSATNQS